MGFFTALSETFYKFPLKVILAAQPMDGKCYLLRKDISPFSNFIIATQRQKYEYEFNIRKIIFL